MVKQYNLLLFIVQAYANANFRVFATVAVVTAVIFRAFTSYNGFCFFGGTNNFRVTKSTPSLVKTPNNERHPKCMDNRPRHHILFRRLFIPLK